MKPLEWKWFYDELCCEHIGNNGVQEKQVIGYKTSNPKWNWNNLAQSALSVGFLTFTSWPHWREWFEILERLWLHSPRHDVTLAFFRKKISFFTIVPKAALWGGGNWAFNCPQKIHYCQQFDSIIKKCLVLLHILRSFGIRSISKPRCVQLIFLNENWLPNCLLTNVKRM